MGEKGCQLSAFGGQLKRINLTQLTINNSEIILTGSAEKLKKPLLLQGNEAIVEGALAAGCRFFAGYPITPATEISEVMSARLPAVDGTFIQMEDEIASMGAVIGASLAGVKAMTATSGPGFSLMQENLGFACVAEVPCVIVNVMRGGPSTGLPTNVSQEDVMQARWGTHGDHPIIVLAVSNVQDCFDLTVKAFNFSEAYRTPVIILSDEVVSHTREKFVAPEASEVKVMDREKPEMPPEWYIPYEDTPHGVPPMGIFGDGYRYHVTGLIHDVRGFPTQRARRDCGFSATPLPKNSATPGRYPTGADGVCRRRPDSGGGLWFGGAFGPAGGAGGPGARGEGRTAAPANPVALSGAAAGAVFAESAGGIGAGAQYGADLPGGAAGEPGRDQD